MHCKCIPLWLFVFYVLQQHDSKDKCCVYIEATGKFTALTGGNYTVTLSGYAALDPGEKVVLQQMHNDQSVGYQGRWNVLKERHILSLPR